MPASGDLQAAPAAETTPMGAFRQVLAIRAATGHDALRAHDTHYSFHKQEQYKYLLSNRGPHKLCNQSAQMYRIGIARVQC